MGNGRKGVTWRDVTKEGGNALKGVEDIPCRRQKFTMSETKTYPIEDKKTYPVGDKRTNHVADLKTNRVRDKKSCRVGDKDLPCRRHSFR